MRRVGPPNKGAPIPAPPPKPTIFSREPTKPQAPPAATTSTSSEASEKNPARPSVTSPRNPQGPMRPVAIAQKPAEDPKYRYQAAIEAGTKSSDLADRALDAKITISTRELLAASPDVRRHVKDIVTSRKVNANFTEVNEVDTYLTSAFDQPPRNETPSVFLDMVKYDSSATAASTLPLRVIRPTFAPGVEPECILDGGAQIIVMRKDIWEQLQGHVAISAELATNMESASATTTQTLGLVENHPVQLGPVTVFLQIQIVEDAPFEVLLGRPFFDVTSCTEISRPGGKHEIQIRDPLTGKLYTFATEPRVYKTPSTGSDSVPQNRNQSFH